MWKHVITGQCISVITSGKVIRQTFQNMEDGCNKLFLEGRVRYILLFIRRNVLLHSLLLCAYPRPSNYYKKYQFDEKYCGWNWLYISQTWIQYWYALIIIFGRQKCCGNVNKFVVVLAMDFQQLKLVSFYFEIILY